MRRQSCELISTLDLSTEVTCLRRVRASSKAKRSDALDLEVAVDQRVARGQHAVFALEALRAEVQPAGQLAHDDQVHPAHELRRAAASALPGRRRRAPDARSRTARSLAQPSSAASGRCVGRAVVEARGRRPRRRGSRRSRARGRASLRAAACRATRSPPRRPALRERARRQRRAQHAHRGGGHFRSDPVAAAGPRCVRHRAASHARTAGILACRYLRKPPPSTNCLRSGSSANADRLAAVGTQRLVDDVDRDRARAHQLVDRLLRQHTGTTPLLYAFSWKMRAKLGAITALKPRSEQRPGGVLARGPAAEVLAGDDDRRVRVQREQLRAVGHPFEEVLAHPVGVDAGEVVRRDDLIGVDVRARNRQHGPSTIMPAPLPARDLGW